jgi:hypothetical protein
MVIALFKKFSSTKVNENFSQQKCSDKTARGLRQSL